MTVTPDSQMLFSICSLWHSGFSPAAFSNGAQEKSGVENGEEDYCQRNHPVWISIVYLRGRNLKEEENVHSVKYEKLVFLLHQRVAPSACHLWDTTSVLVIALGQCGMVVEVGTDKCNGSKP